MKGKIDTSIEELYEVMKEVNKYTQTSSKIIKAVNNICRSILVL